MPGTYSIPEKTDRWGRRSGIDRRMGFFPVSAPERRSNQDRRNGQDRRSREDQGNVINLRRNIDRYMEFTNTQRGLFLAISLSLPFWALIIFLIFIKR